MNATTKEDMSRIKPCNLPEYNSDCPEKFNWGLLDSTKLSACATDYASRIRAELELKGEDRVLTPGLRYALRLLAGTAEI